MGQAAVVLTAAGLAGAGLRQAFKWFIRFHDDFLSMKRDIKLIKEKLDIWDA